MTGADFAHLIRWLTGFAMVRVAGATLVVAERCQMWPRACWALLDIGEACAHVARRMLPP
jgi:hypothetical protein